MPSKCIYDIYKWMAMIYKYSGCIPVPGLYEGKGRSPFKTLLINVVLPVICFSNLSFACFRVFYLGPQRFERNLTDILVYLLNTLTGIAYILYPLYAYFFMSKRLIRLLKVLEDVDDLIKPRRNHLKCFTNFLFAFVVTISLIGHYGFLLARFFRLTNSFFSLQVAALCTAFHSNSCAATQPICMYISFQRVLKCCFDQLLVKIQSVDISKLSQEEAAEKLKYFAQINHTLCHSSMLLDDTVSVVMAMKFLSGYIGTIYCITFVNSSLSVFSLFTIFGIMLYFFVIVLIPNSAQQTKDSAMKILPAVYQAFKIDQKEIKTKMQTFNLQFLYFKCCFTASGFFQLDRTLIFAVVQSILSQWTVFYKIKTGGS